MVKIYKFGAEWCGPCRVLNEKLKNFNGCEIEMFDVDEADEQMLEKFKIRNIPVTVLVDENDNELYRWVGLFNIEEINEKIKEFEK